ncbi:MAG: type II toxin-antitoxin system RatA family toxin [Woeseiaceae bacterium]|nr:type II toxin-antitoxin system RatA family toxin [Woeseiaceae bacterium]
MRSVKRSALLPYKARDMFLLVDDVEAYPEFLPWCNSAREISRSPEHLEATLELQKGSLSKTFTTRNRRREFESIDLELVDGPFNHLQGGWKFEDLGDAGCKVSLELDFEFKSRSADLMFGAFFEQVCNALIDAFATRAAVVHGK